MIEFFSLFIGLTMGPQTIELVVLEPVTEVELRLDGDSLGTVVGEPWSLDHDFGDLAPHELVAIARDGDGQEVDRIRQWINLVPSWKSDRTPVAVSLERGAELPPADEMDRWFLAGGEPVAVSAIERGPAEVTIVRDPAVQPELHAIADSFYEEKLIFLHPTITREQRQKAAWSEGWMDLEPDDTPSRFRARVLEAAQESLRAVAKLGPEVEVGFLSPWATPLSRVHSDREVYAITNRIDAEERGFLEIANDVASVDVVYRLADAVALAASELHGVARRRAIVVMLAQPRQDEGMFTSSQARGYLRSLQVPLLIWSTHSSDLHPDWGRVRHVGFEPRSERRTWSGDFDDAAKNLKRLLKAQRIVWLEGRHLPQSISLGQAARGLRLATGIQRVDP